MHKSGYLIKFAFPFTSKLITLWPEGNDMRHEKTVSVSKIKPLWEPWEEDETPRKTMYLHV